MTNSLVVVHKTNGILSLRDARVVVCHLLGGMVWPYNGSIRCPNGGGVRKFLS